jgi:hypothetical protein
MSFHVLIGLGHHVRLTNKTRPGMEPEWPGEHGCTPTGGGFDPASKPRKMLSKKAGSRGA